MERGAGNGEVGPEEGEADAGAESGRGGATGDGADGLTFGEEGIAGAGRCGMAFNGEGDGPARWALVSLELKGVLAEEGLRFVPGDKWGQASFEWGDVGPEFVAVEREAGFEAKGVAGAESGR